MSDQQQAAELAALLAERERLLAALREALTEAERAALRRRLRRFVPVTPSPCGSGHER